VTVEFTLCPLHKGIAIGKIRMEILERVTLSTEQGRYKTKQPDQVVASCEQDVPENSLQPLTEEQTGIADESFHFKLTLPLERSLVKARQSLETEYIKIWHNLKIFVNLHNPDGHISQVCLVHAKFSGESTDSSSLLSAIYYIFSFRRIYPLGMTSVFRQILHKLQKLQQPTKRIQLLLPHMVLINSISCMVTSTQAPS
jgi:hypothetical protein